MAFYVFGLRNVRPATENTAAGVKDAPRDGITYYFTHEDSGVYTQDEAKALLSTKFPNFTAEVLESLSTALVLGNANSTVRADETTGAGLFRYGKQMFQMGVGYHGSVEATAINAVNWKNIA